MSDDWNICLLFYLLKIPANCTGHLTDKMCEKNSVCSPCIWIIYGRTHSRRLQVDRDNLPMELAMYAVDVYCIIQ